MNSSDPQNQAANNIQNSLNANNDVVNNINSSKKSNNNTADKDQTTLLNFQQFLNSGNNNFNNLPKSSEATGNELKLEMSFCNPGFVNMANRNIDNSDKMDIDEGNHHQNVNPESTSQAHNNINIVEADIKKPKKANKAKKNKEEGIENSLAENKDEALKIKKKKVNKKDGTNEKDDKGIFNYFLVLLFLFIQFFI